MPTFSQNLGTLHANQRRLMEFLSSCSDGAGLDELVSYLGITKSAVREHLKRIEHLGYIAFQDRQGARGRPKRRYFLSDAGLEAFPKQYSWIANLLLDFLSEDLGGEGVGRIMKGLARKVAQGMAPRFDAARDQKHLLHLIKEAMDELGYRVSLVQSDLRKGAVLEARNCVYHSVAKKHPELCKFDVQFLKSASGLDVDMQSCIAQGDASCRFCLRPPKKRTP